jgi:hypothetical protein
MVDARFHFKNFEPDTGLRHRANATLDRILDRAPYGTHAVAMLEREQEGYRASIDLYSKRGPFIASSVGLTAMEALAAVEAKLGRQLALWRANRGIGGAASGRSGEREAEPALTA